MERWRARGTIRKKKKEKCEGKPLLGSLFTNFKIRHCFSMEMFSVMTFDHMTQRCVLIGWDLFCS